MHIYIICIHVYLNIYIHTFVTNYQFQLQKRAVLTRKKFISGVSFYGILQKFKTFILIINETFIAIINNPRTHSLETRNSNKPNNLNSNNCIINCGIQINRVVKFISYQVFKSKQNIQAAAIACLWNELFHPILLSFFSFFSVEENSTTTFCTDL